MVSSTGVIPRRTYLYIRQPSSKIIPRRPSDLLGTEKSLNLMSLLERKETRPPMYLDPKVPLSKVLLMQLTDAEEDSAGEAVVEVVNPLVLEEKEKTEKTKVKTEAEDAAVVEDAEVTDAIVLDM